MWSDDSLSPFCEKRCVQQCNLEQDDQGGAAVVGWLKLEVALYSSITGILCAPLSSFSELIPILVCTAKEFLILMPPVSFCPSQHTSEHAIAHKAQTKATCNIYLQ